MDMISFKDTVNDVLNELNKSLSRINQEQIKDLVSHLLKADKIFFVGVGRVMLMMQAAAKRLKHLGIDTHIVGEITEPPITEKDILVVGSGSGESIIPLCIAQKSKRYGAQIIHITANPSSSISKISDLVIKIPSPTKLHLPDEVESIQPMTTLFEQSLLILMDCISLMIIKEKKLEPEFVAKNHANLE